MSITRSEVEWLYRCVLGRDPDSAQLIDRYVASGSSFEDLRMAFLGSQEFRESPSAPPPICKIVEVPESKQSGDRQRREIKSLAPHDPFTRYLDKTQKKSLVIYMPCVHPSRTSGLAKALRSTGHRLMLSDKSSKTKIFREVNYTPDEARGLYGDHVSSYVDDSFFKYLPDIIIAGRGDNEESTFALYEYTIKRKPVTLVAISGIFQEEYTWSRYDGVLCCDLPSRVLSRGHGVPAIRCAETDWLDDYPSRPMPENGILYLRSFINIFPQRFPLAYAFHNECRDLVQEKYQGKVVIENYENRSRLEVKELMAESAMIFHLKDSDGFGWSVLEGLFIGRPVVYQSGLARNMTYTKWMETDVSGFPIDRPADIIPLVDQFVDNPRLLHETHRRTAEIVRAKYDGPDLSEDMVRFLEDLHKISRMRWLPNRNSTPTRKPKGYSANLDPKFRQDFENVWDEILD